MTEIQYLIQFLENGQREEISLADYIAIQQNKHNWTETRRRQLLSELSRSDAIPPYYKNQNGQVVRFLRIRQV